MATTDRTQSTVMNKIANGTKKDAKAAFGELFLDGYLSKGFGTLSKREIELFVLQSLLQSRSEGPLDVTLAGIDEVELSRELRIRTSRVRSMLVDLRYRYMPSEETLHARLRTAISSGEYDDHNAVIRLQIADVLVREHAKQLAMRHGIVDKALDGSIIQMQPHTFVALGIELLADQFEVQVFKRIPKEKLRGEKSVQVVAEGIVRHVASNAGTVAVQEVVKNLYSSILNQGSLDFLLRFAKSIL